jgi:protein TonB
MTKLISSIGLAILITFGLFAFMASLISRDSVNIPKPLPPLVFDVAKLPEDSTVKIIEKVKLVPPPAPEPIPRNVVTPDAADDTTSLVYQSVPVTLRSGGLGLNKNRAINNNEARPIFRVNPKYPMDAMRKGTQGWVKLAFDVNEIGKVVNVSIIDSQPKRIFDQAARQALRKWKYQAKSVDGQAVYQKSRTVQLDFTMEQQS